jgi:hypothetical protein
MLKLMEFGLLGVTLLIVLGLVLQGPPEAPPVEEKPIGAQNKADEAQPRAS